MGIKVTVVDGLTPVGVYGPNNSINVVVRSGLTSPVGVYHPCGAFNVVLGNSRDMFHPSGAYNAIDEGGG